MKGRISRVIKVQYNGYTAIYDTEEVMPRPVITFHNYYIKKGKQVLVHKVYCDDAPTNVDELKLLGMLKKYVDEREEEIKNAIQLYVAKVLLESQIATQNAWNSWYYGERNHEEI